MRIYHFVPKEEFQLHDHDSQCLCEPELEKMPDDFPLGMLLSFEIYRHAFFSPLPRTPSPDDFVAVADANWNSLIF